LKTHTRNNAANGPSARRSLLAHAQTRLPQTPLTGIFPHFQATKRGLQRTPDFASIEMFRKHVCDQKNLTTDLRLRLLSSTKLVISGNGHGSRHAHIGRARKRSVEGIPVPVEGRE
jgi:hypothetical protein